MVKMIRLAALLSALLGGSAQAQLLVQLPPAALPLSGNEALYVVQNGVSKQTPINSLPQAQGISGNQITGGLVSPTVGGTGVNNGTNTLTVTGGTLTLSLAGATSLTLPTTGTLLNTATLTTTFASPPALGSTTPAAGSFTTVHASGLITPTSSVGIGGTTAADNPAAGSIGQYISSTVLIGSAVSLTSGTPANVTSISLTAGDWDVWGNVFYSANASTVTTVAIAWTSTTSATQPTAPNNGGETAWVGQGVTNLSPAVSAGMQRINVSSTTTVYLSTQSSFTVSTAAAYGFIGARRVR